ncbi:izumo sperm-egg fusion protein 1-like [Spea bombifrons]|uniref:izumo sperm-egg fusion protein 1-like n=1 Tax=Spea bombifrons TaxID=233779 RepID=UPI002349FA0E|nr:izumo sperm-egg fusion protein 1-like [Spea bombifrons]
MPDSQVSGCLKCHQDAERKLEQFQKILKNKHVADFKKVHAYITKGISDITDHFADLLLDKFAISQLVEQLDNPVQTIGASVAEGTHYMNTIDASLKHLKANFSAIFNQFMSERDKACGLMIQTLTSCKNCEEVKVPCMGGHSQCNEKMDKCSLCFCTADNNKCKDVQSGKSCKPCRGRESCMTEILKCGDRTTDVIKGQEVIFDCSLNWHVDVGEPIQYVFKKVVNHKSETLSIRDQPFLEKKDVDFGDAGEYTCTAQTKTKTPVSTLSYRVNVSKGPGMSPNATETPINLDVEIVEQGIFLIGMIVFGCLIIIFSVGIRLDMDLFGQLSNSKFRSLNM